MLEVLRCHASATRKPAPSPGVLTAKLPSSMEPEVWELQRNEAPIVDGHNRCLQSFEQRDTASKWIVGPIVDEYLADECMKPVSSDDEPTVEASVDENEPLSV